MSNIFRAYDVRGIYPEEVNTDIAKRVGNAVAIHLKAPSTHSGQTRTIVVGEDGRISSPELRQAVIKGITSAGADAVYIGQCTTPLFYFSINKLNADGGIMVTASHNPPQYNGFKIVGPKAVPVSSDSGLLDIQKITESNVVANEKIGSEKEISAKDDYVNFLAGQSKTNNLKIVIDASNGVAPIVLNDFFKKINFNIIPINFDIDGAFPNHLSDISKEENLRDLRNKILETSADVGFAFDGDADRLTVLDEQGNKLGAEFVVGLMFKAKSGLFRKPKVAYDLRFSRSIKELIGKNGFPSRTGYSFVRATMKKHDADLGGELSGHFDFKEMNYAESAILAMLRIIEIVAKESKPLSKLIKPFLKYFNSGEINIEIQNREQALENIRAKYTDGKMNELDGITVEYPDWWFNARPSNTEPLVRVVVEADTKELMEQKVSELISEIKKAL